MQTQERRSDDANTHQLCPIDPTSPSLQLLHARNERLRL